MDFVKYIHYSVTVISNLSPPKLFFIPTHTHPHIHILYHPLPVPLIVFILGVCVIKFALWERHAYSGGPAETLSN